jgi:radical SAM superfamily enzyme YgiQ (UPF0313 family)
MKILFYCRGVEYSGVESLMAVLKQAGHSVDLLFDLKIGGIFYYHSRLPKVFQNETILIEKAKRFSPDLLAFSSTTNDYPYVSEMITRLKKILKVPVIVGGVHATAVPEFVMEHPGVDMVCRGEGEEAFLELVDKMSAGKDCYDTRNIWLKKRKGIIKKNTLRPLIKDLDSLPFPDKDLFYKYGCFKDTLIIVSSRGCIFDCFYCHNNLERRLYRRDYCVRRMSVKYLIRLLSYYKKKYKPKTIEFEDDLFAVDKEWLREFSYYYAKEISLPFFCLGHCALLDEETMKLLRQAGCLELYVGVESGNDNLRKRVMKRYVSNQRIKKTVSKIKEYRIKVQVSVIFGWPGETPENMWETVRLCDELAPYSIDNYTLYPYPGTEILRYCQDRGLVDKDSLLKIYQGKGSNITEMVFGHPHKDLAYVMSKLVPVYVRGPLFLKKILKKLMQPRMKKFANFIYLFFIIFFFPKEAFKHLNKVIEMLKKSNKGLIY